MIEVAMSDNFPRSDKGNHLLARTCSRQRENCDRMQPNPWISLGFDSEFDGSPWGTARAQAPRIVIVGEMTPRLHIPITRETSIPEKESHDPENYEKGVTGRSCSTRKETW